MTNAKIATQTRHLAEAPIVFTAYMPLKQHSEPEDGAIEEEGHLSDYVLREDLDWERETEDD
jgi:hypothetical protein